MTKTSSTLSSLLVVFIVYSALIIYSTKPVEKGTQTEVLIKTDIKTHKCKRVIADIVDKHNTQITCLY